MVDKVEQASVVSQGTTASLAASSAPLARSKALLPCSGDNSTNAVDDPHSPSTPRPVDSDEGSPTSSTPNNTNPAIMNPDQDEPNTERDAASVRLPEELWLKVIAHLPPKDLKKMRLVKTSFKDFATPSLFRNAVFSPEPASIRSLKLLAKREHLAKHVKRLFLDTTTYPGVCTPDQYAKLASDYFSKVFGVGPQEKGPLSHTGLYALLLTDPFKSVGPSFLSGKPRGAFTAGYTLYSARAHYLIELFQKDKLFSILTPIISGFKQLDEVASVSYWTENDDCYQDDFKLYLRQHLPQKTLDLIFGPKTTEKDNSKGSGVTTSAFAAPGVAARDLHVMMLPPNYGICYHDMQIHEITNATLRALRENKVRLKFLSLPGSDYLGQNIDVRGRRGVIPLTTLLSGTKTPGATRPTGLLLPVLRRLKVLELNIDFKHPGGPGLAREPRPQDRLRTALQQMNQLESLSLGAPVYLVGDPAAWTLTELLLWKIDDYPEQPSVNPGDDPGGHGPPLPALNGLMNIIMSLPGFPTAPNGANPPPQTQATANAANPAQPAAAPATSTSTAQTSNSTQATTGGPPGGFFAQLLGGGLASIDNQGNVSSQPIGPTDFNNVANGGNNGGSGSQEAVKLPDKALTPNPWPKLRYLSLWNLPSSPEEVARLVRTVKDTLRGLKLSNVYFARPEIVDPEYDMYFDVGFDGPPPPMANAPAQSAGTNPQGDDEQQDLPDLVDMATEPPVNGSSTVTGSPTIMGPSMGSGAPNVPPSVPDLFNPAPSAPQGGPQPAPENQGESSQDGNPGDTSDMWLSTIEVLADELRLTACDILIEDHDEEYLRQKLSRDITGVQMARLGHIVGHYLLEGEGMGFTLFLANQLKADRDAQQALVLDLLQDLGEDDEEGEDRGHFRLKEQPKPRNRHVCSNWQACPGPEYASQE